MRKLSTEETVNDVLKLLKVFGTFQKVFAKYLYNIRKLSYLCSVNQEVQEMQVLIEKIATIKSRNCAH